MNFRDLAERLRSIEESPAELNHDGTPPVEECGEMPMPAAVMHQIPSQQDNVSMSVNMNGQGAGGIKDLMDILRNIEKGAEHGKTPLTSPAHALEPQIKVLDDLLSDKPETSVAGGAGAGDEDYAQEGSEQTVIGHDIDDDKDHDIKNRPHRVTYNIDTITRHGDDIHSKGDVKRLKVNGGENPLQEGLVERLHQLYDSIKEGEKKTMSRAAKGVMKYGKDGMQALAKAGKEGKDLDKIRDKYNKYD